MSEYNESNFFETTSAVFDICERPERTPDFVSGSGSEYWYEDGKVIRNSDHWGNGIASCNWWIRDFDMMFCDFMSSYNGFLGIGLIDVCGKTEVCASCDFEGFRDLFEFRKEYDAVASEIGFKVNPLF